MRCTLKPLGGRRASVPASFKSLGRTTAQDTWRWARFFLTACQVNLKMEREGEMGLRSWNSQGHTDLRAPS